MGMNRSSGFTLIELLVVIAIIALLMSILMPALYKAKEQSRTVICRSNLHQYGLAARMYVDENRGRFPFSLTWLFSQQPSHYCQWHDRVNNLVNHPEYAGVLWPYLKDFDIHACRTFKMVARNRGCSDCGGSGTIPIEPQYSYSQNAFVGGDGRGMVELESQVKQTSRVFIYSEENSWEIPGLSRCGINDNNLRVGIPPDVVDCFATYHNPPGGDLNKGSANAVFVDLHVDTIKADEQPDGGNFKFAWPRSTPPQ